MNRIFSKPVDRAKHATRSFKAHAVLLVIGEILSRPSRSWGLAFACVAVIALASSSDAAVMPHGRFLPDPAATTPVFSYGNPNPVAFDRNILCDNNIGEINTIGEIKFDYDTYLSDPAGATRGGGALSGGFYLDPLYRLSPGMSLAWVQTVIATRTGENDWGIDPTKGPFDFPDAKRTTPAYPFTTTAETPPNPPGPPTLGFQDFPSRAFANGDQSWLAQLGLVCIEDAPDDTGFRKAFVITTFLWGFGVDTAPVNQITASAPQLLGPPTPLYLATLNDYYDGSPPNPPTSGGVSSLFRFQEECDCFQPVPEPATFIIWAVGSVVLLSSSQLRGRRLAATSHRTG